MIYIYPYLKIKFAQSKIKHYIAEVFFHSWLGFSLRPSRSGGCFFIPFFQTSRKSDVFRYDFYHVLQSNSQINSR